MRRAVYNVCYIVALTAWVLVLSRLALLITMGVTVSVNTTMVVNPYYGAPVFFSLMCAAVLSIAAALQVFYGRVPELCEAPSDAGRSTPMGITAPAIGPKNPVGVT